MTVSDSDMDLEIFFFLAASDTTEWSLHEINLIHVISFMLDWLILRVVLAKSWP